MLASSRCARLKCFCGTRNALSQPRIEHAGSFHFYDTAKSRRDSGRRQARAPPSPPEGRAPDGHPSFRHQWVPSQTGEPPTSPRFGTAVVLALNLFQTAATSVRSEEHTSELQSRQYLV